MQIAKHIITGLFCLPCLLFTSRALAYGEYDYTPREYEQEGRIWRFWNEYIQLSNASGLQIRITDSNIESGSFIRLFREKVQVMNDGLQSVDFRWNAFVQQEQADLAGNEDLMKQMAQVQNLRQAVADTIAAAQKRCDAIADFIAAERFILAQDTIYAKLYKRARLLSLTNKTAPRLEKVKAQEQALFAKLKEHYDKSRAATALVPQLSKRATIIDEHYYSLKTLDEKIQAMKYQPLIVRIKDYLMGLACVSVILLFLNMVATKLQAIKKARELFRKQKEVFGKTGEGDYPCI